MNKKKNISISIIIVVLIIFLISSVTFAFMVASTGGGSINTGSGMLGINYTAPENITGTLSPSIDRNTGLLATATASMKTGSEVAVFNMYLTPTDLTNLNIPALKWEAEGIRNGEIVCYGSGDFSTATVDEPIKLFANDITDNVRDCVLNTEETTFNVYVWLDVNLIDSAISGSSFGATIGADSVEITGRFEDNMLPSIYQKVEYIEATGTQYLEIDYIASDITNSKGTYQITDDTLASVLFGSRKSTIENAYTFNWGGSQPWKYYNVYYTASNAITNKTIDLQKHTFEKNGGELYLDGVRLNPVKEYTNTFTTPNKMIVFGCNTDGTIGLFSKARIYSLQFYDGDVLKVDLVPCYRKSDGEIGMYDLVNDKFYTNKGTDDFVKGNEVIPSIYQKVEYIEATGTQYLEIDYVASNVTSSKGTYQLTNDSTAKMLFGSRTSSSENAYTFNWGGTVPYRYYNTYYKAYYSGTGDVAIVDKTIDLEKHTFKKLGRDLYIDDVLLGSRNDITKTFKTPNKMIIFGCNTNGTIGLLSEARIFELEFYDGDVLKTRLIPCYRKSDGEIGMFDLIENKFYTNKGTGVFVKGNDV